MGGRGPNSALPHINLRIKENLLPISVSNFRQHLQLVASSANRTVYF
jgi:hypothetical protein